jgi:hypothetical protein
MLIYLGLFALVTILFFKPLTKTTSGIIFFVFIISCILLAGIRDMIGGFDVYIYGQTYEMPILQLINLQIFEPGFVVFYSVLHYISTDRAFMFFITSVIILGGHFYVYRKLSIWPYFTIFIFFCKFYLMSFVYLRQGIAMVLVLCAVSYLVKKKILPTLLILMLAFLFHKSAVIFLPFIFIAYYRFSYFQIIFLAFLLFALSLTGLGSDMILEFSKTTENEKLAKYALKSDTINYFYIIEGLLILILTLKFRLKFYLRKENIIYFNGILIYGLIIIFSITNATFIRFSWYYFSFLCLGFPLLYKFISELSLKKLFKNLIFVYYSLVFFRLLLVYDGGDFYPYKSIFQDFERNGRWEFMEYKPRKYFNN